MKNGKIRTIGDPEIRFSEDPVRILRALKLKASLNFNLVEKTHQAMLKCIPKLSQAPKARLLLEVQKILRSGASYSWFNSLAEYGILKILSPDLQRVWQAPDPTPSRSIQSALQGIDHLTRAKRKSLSEATLLAAICFPIVRLTNKMKIRQELPSQAFCKKKLAKITASLSISKRLLEGISEIIRGQFYFDAKYHQRIKQKKSRSHSIDTLELFKIRTWASLEKNALDA